MPFRAAFDCLWCGARHVTRTPDDLEGWAALCPDCLGRAQDNGFLAARLRAALRERAMASTSGATAPGPGAERADPTGATRVSGAHVADPGAVARAIDDWYLRRGPAAQGPLHDLPWQMELDEATGWLDRLPLGGVIIELAAGTGFWSPLLAQKGELWLYEEDVAALDAARARLVAHGLRAHLHRLEPFAAPERRADALFVAFLLGTVADDTLVARMRGLGAWLGPGGRLCFIECSASRGPALRGPRGELRCRTAAELGVSLAAAGFEDVTLRETATAFLLGTAVSPPEAGAAYTASQSAR